MQAGHRTNGGPCTHRALTGQQGHAFSSPSPSPSVSVTVCLLCISLSLCISISVSVSWSFPLSLCFSLHPHLAFSRLHLQKLASHTQDTKKGKQKNLSSIRELVARARWTLQALGPRAPSVCLAPCPGADSQGPQDPLSPTEPRPALTPSSPGAQHRHHTWPDSEGALLALNPLPETRGSPPAQAVWWAPVGVAPRQAAGCVATHRRPTSV